MINDLTYDFDHVYIELKIIIELLYHMTNISSFGSRNLIPQEEKLELKKQPKSLFIGVPKEITFQESRIAIVPDAVQLLVSHGHEVILNLRVMALILVTKSIARQELKLFTTQKKSIRLILF